MSLIICFDINIRPANNNPLRRTPDSLFYPSYALLLVEYSSRHFRSSMKHVASVISVQELRNSTRSYLSRVFLFVLYVRRFSFVFSLLISRRSYVRKTRLRVCSLIPLITKMDRLRKKRITDDSDELVGIMRVKYADTSRTYHRL